MKKGTTLLLLLWICLGFTYTAHAAKYYWVGGSGLWNDPTQQHWSSSPTGSTAPADLYATPPTLDDDVIFNQFSFTSSGQTVTLPSGNASCRDFAWTNILSSQSPTLQFSSNSTLNVYGTFSLDADVTVSYNSITSAFIKMVGSNVNPAPGVFSAGKVLPNLEFNAAGGQWGITGPLNVEGRLSVINGELGSGATNVRRVINVGEFIINGADAIVDLYRMDITARTRFQVINANEIDAQQGGNTSNISTPLFQVSAPGALTFGQLTLTGSNGSLDATGRSLTFDGDLTMAATGTNTILGSHTINGDLVITGLGSTVLFEAGSTQTLDRRQVIRAVGTNCRNYITLRSTVSGTAATIAKTPQNNNDKVSVDFVNIQDVHINDGGAGSFSASNSSDLGNNSGWIFAPLVSNTLFWIGGSGNWSDGSHWSTTSGGAALNCIPRAVDDVVFDNNSFSSTNQIVAVDRSAIYFGSMTWTDPDNDRPSWSIPSGSVNVGGSLTLAPSMKLAIGAPAATRFNFISDQAGNTITAEDLNADGFDLANVSFTGSGSWTLNGVLNVITGNLNLNNGTFDTGSNHFIFANKIVIDGNATIINFNDSNIQTESFEMLSIGTFNPGTSNIYTSLFDIKPTGIAFSELFLEGTQGILRGENLTFVDVQLTSLTKSTVFGSHTYTNLLQFNEFGMIVEFEAGTVQKINNLVSLGLDCGNEILVRTTVSGSPVTFQALPGSGNITVTNILLQDNTADAAGQAMTFSAAVSQDLGNNVGWDFSGGGVASRDFYWIGGTGRWNDSEKWSFTTGGPAADCIPTPSDNVFFDAKSFPDPNQTITLDGAEQYCRNMIWTDEVVNVPTMSIPGGNLLNIYGTLRLTSTSNMKIDFGGSKTAALWFKATSENNTINTFGHILPNVNFSGPAGGWNLTSRLSVDGIINLADGHFNTNGSEVNATQFLVSGPNAILSLGASSLHIIESFKISAISTLNPGSSILSTNELSCAVSGVAFNEVSLIDDTSNAPNIDDNAELTGTGLVFNNLFLAATGRNLVHGNHTYNGTLRFDIATKPALFLFDVGSTQTFGPNGNILSNTPDPTALPPVVQTPTSSQTATFFKASGFLCWENGRIFDIGAAGGASFGYVSTNAFAPPELGWVAVESCAALPVECVDFTATVQADNNVALYWTTAQELNNSGFEVQRSVDGRRFDSIAWIAGVGTTTEPQKYTYLDQRTNGLDEVYYRLLQIDYDGSKAYACDVVAISLHHDGRAASVSVFPNPANERLQVRWFGKEEGTTLIRLFDQSGRLILNREWNTLKGNNQQELPIADLPNGIYELMLLQGNGQGVGVRVVKQ